jgi:hypothetical protein
MAEGDVLRYYRRSPAADRQTVTKTSLGVLPGQLDVSSGRKDFFRMTRKTAASAEQTSFAPLAAAEMPAGGK